MRNRILLKLTFIFVFSQFALCQGPDNPSIISLDFKTKKFIGEDLLKLEKGDFYQVEVNSINLNLYNVSIEKKDSNFVSSVTFPTIEMLGIDQISKIASNIFTSTSSSVWSGKEFKQKAIEENKVPAKQELAALIQKSDTLNKLIKYEFGANLDTLQLTQNALYTKEILKNDEKIKLKQTEINKMDDEIESLTKLIENDKKNKEKTNPEQFVLGLIDENKIKVKVSLTNSKSVFEDINKMVNLLTVKGLTYLESLNEKKNPSIICNSEIQFDSIQQKSKDYRTKIEDKIDEIVKIDTSFSQLKSSYKDQFEKSPLVKKAAEELTLALKESKAALEKEVAKISETKITEFLTGLINFENNGERKYLSLPIQHNGDMHQLTVIITPKKPEYGPSYKVEYQFPLKKFYVGIGGGFYYATNMRNDVYSSREEKLSDSISEFYVVNENQKKGEVGFSTLLHIGTKLSKSNLGSCGNLFGIHATVGPSISLNATPQLRLTTGVGFSIGKERNMMTIDFLTMTGYVQRLSSVFEEKVPYDSKPEQPTISKLQSSFAIGLGYIYKF